MPPSTQDVLNGLIDLQTAAMPPGWRSILKSAETEIERLRDGFRDIKKATVEGRVCDDVAWFDTITTLYDFCDLFLSIEQPAEQTVLTSRS